MLLMRRLVLLAILLLLPSHAFAHAGIISGVERQKLTVSRSTWRSEGRTLTANLLFVRHQLEHIGVNVPESVDFEGGVNEEAVKKALIDKIVVTRQGKACDAVTIVSGDTKDQVTTQIQWQCPGGSEPILVTLGFFDIFDPDHRHLASISDESGARTEVLGAANPVVKITAAPGVSSWLSWSFFKLGIEHILIGWDHLLFLFALILLGGTFKSLFGTITAFTIAHSITLALAALEIWTPGPAIVEPMIGATIAYVGFENLFLKEPKGRWRITFLLGLIHGFGFAGALKEVGIAQTQLATTLLMFNLGVEVGQLMVLAVFLPLVLLARRSKWVVNRAVPVLSAGIGVTGLVLAIMRIVEAVGRG